MIMTRKCIDCEFRDVCCSLLKFTGETWKCKEYKYSEEKENNKDFIYEEEA
jgi:hypothetical protein